MNAFYLRMSPVNRGMVMVLGVVAFFTLMDTISKYLSRYYPVSLILWARFFFHTLLFVAVLAPRIGTELIRTRRLGWQLLRGLLLASAAFCFVTAIKYMPLAEATAIAYLNPILISLLAVFFLDEKIEFGRWVAIFVAFAGVLIVIRPGSSVFTWAALLPLLNAFLFAAYQVATRRLANVESQYSLIFYPGLVGLGLFSLVAIPVWTLPTPFHLCLLVIAGFISGAGHLVMIHALKLAPASRLAPFSYTQLVWVMLAGYLMFGNFPDGWSLLGIGLLIASGLYCVHHQRSSERESRAVTIETLPGD